MDLQAQIAEAIVAELKRQSAEGSELTIEASRGSAEISGHVDLEALAMAVSGAVAGGP